MLVLTLTAGTKPVTIQDPKVINTSTGQATVVSLTAGEVKSIIVSDAFVERVRPQLDALAADYGLTFAITGAEMSYADGVLMPDNPMIDTVSARGFLEAGDTLTVVGTNLVTDNQAFATASIPGDTVAGSVKITATKPGAAPNGKYKVIVVDSGSGDLAVSCTYDAPTQVRTLIVDLGGSALETCTTVAAAIAASVDADLVGYMFASVVGVGATAITATHTVVSLAGGAGVIFPNSGTFYFETIAVPCVIKSVDISAYPKCKYVLATPDLTTVIIGTSKVGMTVTLFYVNEGKHASISLQIIAIPGP